MQFPLDVGSYEFERVLKVAETHTEEAGRRHLHAFSSLFRRFETSPVEFDDPAPERMKREGRLNIMKSNNHSPSGDNQFKFYTNGDELISTIRSKTEAICRAVGDVFITTLDLIRLDRMTGMLGGDIQEMDPATFDTHEVTWPEDELKDHIWDAELALPTTFTAIGEAIFLPALTMPNAALFRFWELGTRSRFEICLRTKRAIINREGLPGFEADEVPALGAGFWPLLLDFDGSARHVLPKRCEAFGPMVSAGVLAERILDRHGSDRRILESLLQHECFDQPEAGEYAPTCVGNIMPVHWTPDHDDQLDLSPEADYTPELTRDFVGEALDPVPSIFDSKIFGPKRP